ncbi:MAG: hypothetical protein ACYTET_05905 [Planctomycetota bacterium]|jgi:aminomethyltransferase
MLKTSPFDGVHKQLDATFGDYDGWSLPGHFGDQQAEADAMANHCAAVDLSSFSRIMLKGKPIKDVLKAVFESKKGKFLADRWTWGKISIGGEDVFCRIVRANGDCLVLTPPAKGEAVCQEIQSKSDGAVTTTDVTEKTAMLGLYGPAAFESIQGVLPFDIGDLEPGDATKMSFFMMSFTLLRGSWVGVDGLELICPVAAGPIAGGAVAKYRHKHNITPAGMECLKAAMGRMDPPF